MRSALAVAAALALAPCARALAPLSLRVDLHLGDGPFITLDSPHGVSPNISFSWALPAGIDTQSAARVLVTTPAAGGARTVFDSGFIVSPATPWLAAGAAQALALARTALMPATAYDWTVVVRDGAGAESDAAAPQRFFTSAGADAWATTEPVWAPACGGGAAPSFAYLRGALPLRAGVGLFSALLYVTGSPPFYSECVAAARGRGGRRAALARAPAHPCAHLTPPRAPPHPAAPGTSLKSRAATRSPSTARASAWDPERPRAAPSR